MNRYRISPPPERAGLLVWAAGMGLLLVAGAAALHGWSEEGVRTLVRSSAKCSVVCFGAAFGASSLRAFWRSRLSAWALRNRRHLGLSFASFHFLHLGALVALGLAFPSPFLDQLQPVTLVGGGVAYVFIAAQAATSNDAAVRFLGRARWSLLHTVGSYYIWAIFSLSYVPRAFQSALYVPFAVLLVGVVTLRAARALRARSLAASRAASRAGDAA